MTITEAAEEALRIAHALADETDPGNTNEFWSAVVRNGWGSLEVMVFDDEVDQSYKVYLQDLPFLGQLSKSLHITGVEVTL